MLISARTILLVGPSLAEKHPFSGRLIFPLPPNLRVWIVKTRFNQGHLPILSGREGCYRLELPHFHELVGHFRVDDYWLEVT